jgi:hypothetical protein
LFSEHEECKNLKLVKYKVGIKNVAFFFLYRNKEDESLSGFYFFVIKKLDDLQNKVNFVVDY